MKTSQARRQLFFGACALSLLLCSSACTSVNPASAAGFATGVSAARAQTKTAFDTVAGLTRAASLDYAAAQPSLNEAVLGTTPSPEAVAAWNRVFDPLEHYAQHLAALAGGGSTAEMENAVGRLAQEFNTTSASLQARAHVGSGVQLTAGPASALASVAGALVQAHAAKEAAGVAKATDASIRSVLTALADAIGADSSGGLRATVRASWEQQLMGITGDFLSAGGPDRRKPIVLKYIDLLEQRDAMDEQLASLRGTYLALADAHTAIASGSEPGLRGAIDFISSELKHARDLQQQFAKNLSP